MSDDRTGCDEHAPYPEKGCPLCSTEYIERYFKNKSSFKKDFCNLIGAVCVYAAWHIEPAFGIALAFLILLNALTKEA